MTNERNSMIDEAYARLTTAQDLVAAVSRRESTLTEDQKHYVLGIVREHAEAAMRELQSLDAMRGMR